MKKYDLTKKEIDEKILDLRSRDFLELEVGTPIGVESKEQLEEITVSTEKNRFNYAKLTQKARDWYLR